MTPRHAYGGGERETKSSLNAFEALTVAQMLHMRPTNHTRRQARASGQIGFQLE
jgi:hypothetical protein